MRLFVSGSGCKICLFPCLYPLFEAATTRYHFESLVRQEALIDVLTLAVYGTLCGKRSFTEMEYFLKLREEQLTEVFGLANGVPSHDVFSRVFRLIDPEQFMRCFVDWLKEAYLLVTGKHLALDGKAMRAAAEKSRGGITPYVISA